MEEPDKQDENNNSFFQKLKKDNRIQKGRELFLSYRVEIVSGALMLIGIILSFFYIQIGSAIVGLAFGIGFFKEIQHFLLGLRSLYVERGLFKTVLFIATVLFFLLAIPAFVVAACLGFGVIYLIGYLSKKNF